MDSIQRVLDHTQSGDDFYILLGDFLDEFYRADDETRYKMIADEPAGPGLLCRQEFLCFAAATAHKLANDFGLAIPPWVFDAAYYLRDRPFFACHAKGDLRLLFMYKSPAEFKHRNLFVDEFVLSRV